MPGKSPKTRRFSRVRKGNFATWLAPSEGEGPGLKTLSLRAPEASSVLQGNDGHADLGVALIMLSIAYSEVKSGCKRCRTLLPGRRFADCARSRRAELPQRIKRKRSLFLSYSDCTASKIEGTVCASSTKTHDGPCSEGSERHTSIKSPGSVAKRILSRGSERSMICASEGRILLTSVDLPVCRATNIRCTKGFSIFAFKIGP